MKKELKESLLSALLVLCIFCTWALICYADSHYTHAAHVTNVNGTLVCFEDNLGELWFWESETENEFAVGEYVTLTMFDAGTPANIYDDMIDSIHR